MTGMAHRRRFRGMIALLLWAAPWSWPAAARPDGPPVTPQAAADGLLPPGGDSYGEAIDWDAIPPWRQTSFFGVRARGQVFVYVVDCSGSMADGGRLARAKQELRRSIAALRFPQRYLIIFYNDRPWPMPGGIPRSADPQEWSRTFSWMGLIAPEGETEPRGALALALGLRPDAVFLLSDGAFPAGSVEAMAQKNPRKIPVHWPGAPPATTCSASPATPAGNMPPGRETPVIVRPRTTPTGCPGSRCRRAAGGPRRGSRGRGDSRGACDRGRSRRGRPRG
jgi:hypothetical protein